MFDVCLCQQPWAADAEPRDFLNMAMVATTVVSSLREGTIVIERGKRWRQLVFIQILRASQPD